MIELSIIIVNWNTSKLLRNCLYSIFETIKRNKFEIYVVDNNSSDNSVAMVKEEFKGVNLIINKENIGFARANNQSIKLSKGEFVMVLNPDTILLPNAVDGMVDFLKSHKNIGAIGPKILQADGKVSNVGARRFPNLLFEFFNITSLNRQFPKSKLFGKYWMSFWDHNDLRQVECLTGACMIVRKKVIDNVGLLDENFFMYSEDIDWCYRIKKGGWDIYYYPEAEIMHLNGQSSKQKPIKSELEYYRSKYKYFKKHKGYLYSLFYRVMVSLIMLPKCIYNFLLLATKRDNSAQIKLRLKCYEKIIFM